jgi:hypothetical protein
MNHIGEPVGYLILFFIVTYPATFAIGYAAGRQDRRGQNDAP